MSDEQLSKILNTLSKDKDEMYFISKLKLLNKQELKVMSDMVKELEKLEDEKNKIFETAFNKMKHLKKEKQKMKIKNSKTYLFESVNGKDCALTVLDDVIRFLNIDEGFDINAGSTSDLTDMFVYADKYPYYIKLSEK